MKLPPITPKQIEIINLVYKYRYLTSTQIQLFLNHKDKMRINLWLKDLNEKEYLSKIYSHKIGENIKPAIYYSGINAIRYYKTLDMDNNYLKKLYRDNERTNEFLVRQIFIADICLDLITINNQGKDKYEFHTAADCTSNPIYSFLEDLSPQLLITKNDNKQYILVMLDSNMPKYRVKKKIKSYIELFYESAWEDNIGTKFPTILFACESKALLIFAKKTARYLLEDYQDPEDLQLWFGLYDDIQEYGVDGEIWEWLVTMC